MPTLAGVELLARVKADTNLALKARDRERVSALRLVSSELQKAHKDAQPSGADEVAVLQRERKRRLEASQAYRAAGREELAQGEEREAAVIDEYLPSPLTDAELHAIVGDAVAESGASSPKDLGRVMALAMARTQGRADGKRVSALVRDKLTT